METKNSIYLTGILSAVNVCKVADWSFVYSFIEQTYLSRSLGKITAGVRFSGSQDRKTFRSAHIFPLFIYFWLRWVFIAARGLSLVAVSRDYSCCRTQALGCWLQWLWHMGLVALQQVGSS